MKITDKSLLDSAAQTLETEAASLLELKQSLNADFPAVIRKIFSSKGRVIISGIGKSALIAQKIVATFNSTGTPAMFMHAADAIHGDLGMVQSGDVVMCISKSGDTPEIKLLVPLVKNNNNPLIGMVGNIKSYLASHADLILNTTVSKEACPNNLAPTSSSIAQAAMGDAVAICLLKLRGFSPADFAKFHPGGILGKQLYLKVSDLAMQHPKPRVYENDSIYKVILEITSNRLGATTVLNSAGKVVGIITDGDLRRSMENPVYQKLKAKEIMGRNPKTIATHELALNALELMRTNKITQVIVMNKNTYAGMVHVHDLLKEGLV
ncbi:MAG: KpsF/GutQ family sugar-phosphate isomerase [Chitinophagales bacterium]